MAKYITDGYIAAGYYSEVVDTISFDPTNRVILLDVFNVSASQIWSAWVDWLVLSDNLKYLPAFSQVGGVAPIALYLILENGWRVRPKEASGITTITGNLLTRESDSPITQTIGTWNVQVNLETPIAAQAIEVNTGSAVNQATVQAALTAQGYTTARATMIDTVTTVDGKVDGITTNIATVDGKVDGITTNIAAVDGKVDGISTSALTSSDVATAILGAESYP
jgi:DNA-binding FrmR family transcriptional regulator